MPLPPDLLDRFSRSVRSLAASLGERPVSAWEIVRRLLADHPDYGGSSLTPQLAGREGDARPLDMWLWGVARRYDADAMRREGVEVIDGRMTILALGAREPEVAAWLTDSALATRLAEGLRVDPLRLRSSEERIGPRRVLTGHDGPVLCVALGTLAGREVVVSGGGDDSVRVWDPASGEPRVLTGHGGDIWSVALGTLGGREVMVSGGGDGTVRIWDAAGGEPRVLPADAGWVQSVALGTLGGREVVVSGHYDGTVRVWDPASDELRVSLTGHPSNVWSVALGTLGGREVVVSGGADRTVRVWDPATGEPRVVLTGHTGIVWSVALGTLGGRDMLVSGGEDRTLRVWDPATGEPRVVLTGHASAVRSVALGTLGGRDVMVSGGIDGTVRIWDAASGEPRVLTGHTDGVRSVALGTLGGREMVVSGCHDGTVRVWGPLAPPSVLGGYASDSDRGEDELGIEHDVNALVDLIAHRETAPPLSIGLFGDWGSGKSFFMGRMRERTRELTADTRAMRSMGEESDYLANVRSIVFNAWHYADANLWASLTTHIFRELTLPDDAEGPERAAARSAHLLEQLARASGRAERLRAAEERARRARAARRLTRLAALGLVEASGATGDVNGLLDTAESGRGALGAVRRSGTFWWALALGAAGLVACLLAARAWGWSELGRALSAALGFVAGVAAYAGLVARRVRPGIERLRAELDAANANAELEAAERRVAELRREIAERASGERLTRFAAEREAVGDYRAQLSLISHVRRDFEELSGLLAPEDPRDAPEPPPAAPPAAGRRTVAGLLREYGFPVPGRAAAEPEATDIAPPEAGPPPIQRIVLYIDDLDRCPPDRVVEVLEAAHLLLAMPLFVVVIGVDPAWLLSALRTHHAAVAAPNEETREQVWVEKIIQVPFTLMPMTEAGAGGLVRRLLREPEARAASAPVQQAPEAGAPGPGTGPSEGTPEREAAPAGLRAAASAPARPFADLRPERMAVTEPERAFAARLAAAFHTPRAVKKYTNLYRLLRAGLDEPARARFLADEPEGEEIPEYQAALVFLALTVELDLATPAFVGGLGDLSPDCEATGLLWREFLRLSFGLDPDAAAEEEHGRALAFLRMADRELGPRARTTTVEPFRVHALRIARFSFTAGRHVVDHYRRRALLPDAGGLRGYEPPDGGLVGVGDADDV